MSALSGAAAKALLALVILFITGRLLLRPTLRIIASFHNAELFTATTLLIVLGVAWATHSAGLSLALGAFMAGLLIAETEYQHQVEADISPYKALLLGLFFMSVGMSIDFSLMLAQFKIIALLALAVMTIKTLTIAGLCRLFGFSLSVALPSGLLLSQGGEFAFILFNMAAQEKLIPHDLSQILLVMVTLTMALTPLLAALGKTLARRLERKSRLALSLTEEMTDLENHVIIAGYGRMGRTVGKLLSAEGIHYLALDTNPDSVAEGRAQNRPVYYGDATRPDVLESIGVKRARAAIVTIRDEGLAEKTVRALRAAHSELPLIVRAKDLSRAHRMEKAGANVTVPEIFEGSLQLGAAVLRTLDIPEHEIARIIEIFRDQGYALTRQEAEA